MDRRSLRNIITGTLDVKLPPGVVSAIQQFPLNCGPFCSQTDECSLSLGSLIWIGKIPASPIRSPT